MKRACIIIFIQLLTFASVFGQGEFDFGDEPKNQPDANKSENALSGLSLRGSVSLETSYQTEDYRWIRLGPALHLLLEYPNNFLSIYGEATGRVNAAYTVENDPGEVINAYTAEFIGREIYVQKNIGKLTLSLGNKMVVWSVADILPVYDLISVADMTEALFANPEEARLGQNIMEADVFFDKIEINMVWSPYPVFNRITDNSHPYSLTPGFRIDDPPVSRESEWAVRIRYFESKISFSALGGSVHNRIPYFTISPDFTSLTPGYATSYFAGAGLSLALDPFLWKLETRYSFKKPFQKTAFNSLANADLPDGRYLADEAALTLGFDYNAGDIGMFIAEGSYLLEENDFGSPTGGIWTAAFGWTKSFVSDQLSVSAFGILTDAIDNIIFRLQTTYSITDVMDATMQYTAISLSGIDQYYESLSKLDRFDFILRYHFAFGGNH